MSELASWNNRAEQDVYYYVKELFVKVFGYPKDRVRMGERGSAGVPDMSLMSQDSNPKRPTFWIVAEVKPEPGRFRKEAQRKERWANQLKKYVTADTVFALLIDPKTIVVLAPDGRELHVFDLEAAQNAAAVVDSGNVESLSSLTYANSLSDIALVAFKTGKAPSRFLDVTDEPTKEHFYEALRTCAGDLQAYAASRLEAHEAAYAEYRTRRRALEAAKISDSAAYKQRIYELEAANKDSIQLIESVLPEFEVGMGREPPKDKDAFVRKVYTTEAANLILARILFVRFLEDYDKTTRKISNGGVSAFRSFHRYVKDDYRFLLDSAFRDLRPVYARLFERSIFDWAHAGNGELSKCLLRVFFRLNAFDFTKISGDILGNLYERFLDPKSRKDLGEFYTPVEVVDYILAETGFIDKPDTILDPSCGSGTFLFRAIDHAIATLRKRGVPYKDAIKIAVGLVHGIDVNIFAAFIAQLQVIWHLFPHLEAAKLSELPPLNIYGGVNSLEAAHQRSLEAFTIDRAGTMAQSVRDQSYAYVVGNPPYIRVERMKDSGHMQDLYKDAVQGKGDLMGFFLWRCFSGTGGSPPWLKADGTMGFIVPYSLADSKGNQGIRAKLLENRVLSLTDLECVSLEVFTSGIAASRATVAPIIVVAQRGVPKPNATVQVRVATKTESLTRGILDLARTPGSTVPLASLRESPINPFGLFLTKVRDADVPVLEALMTDSAPLSDCAYPAPGNRQGCTIQIGARLGTGDGKLSSEPKRGHFPMAKGQHLHTYCLNETAIDEYVALAKMDNQSIWAHQSYWNQPAYLLSELVLAPQAAPMNTKDYIGGKSCLVFLPKEEYGGFPWDAYLNSIVVRYVFALCMRSALIGATEDITWSHLNVEAVRHLPVKPELLADGVWLKERAEELRRLAAKILNKRRDLDDVIATAPKRPMALAGLIFENLQPELFARNHCVLRGSGSDCRLVPMWRNQETFSALRGDSATLTVIQYMINHPEFQLGVRPTTEIPTDCASLAVIVEQITKGTDPDIARFKDLVSQVDARIGAKMGLTAAQMTHLTSRLEAEPFHVMQPRWPWTPAEIRATQVYTEDRYA